MKEEKGRGMPYFERDHWQKKIPDVNLGKERYASEMNTEEEYRMMVNKQTAYLKSHKAEH
jgi:hypothetical protein